MNITRRMASTLLSHLLGWACLVAPGGAAFAASLSLGSAVTQPSQDFSLPLVLTHSEAEPVAAIQCDVTFDPSRFTLTGASATQLLTDAGKQLQTSELSAGRWRIVAFGFNQNIIPAGQVASILFTTAAGVPAGENLIPLENPILSNTNGQPIPVTTSPATVTIGLPSFHSADTNQNLVIDLNELLRGIQLFNAGEFFCQPGSEDGYGLFSGTRDCSPHSSDYKNGADWRINLTELLRLIQFFNLRGYVPSSTTEDGFDPAVSKYGN